MMAATTMTVEQFTPGSTSTRSLPRPVSYLGAVDPSTGLPRRPSLSLSLSLSLLGPFGETFSDCVCIFNVAWPFGLFGRVGGARGTATMCTHFIHQCAAAQNDGNAKTNDDVCLSLSLGESLVENCLRWQVEEAMSVSCQ